MKTLELNKKIKFGKLNATKHYWTEQYDDFERGVLIVESFTTLDIKGQTLECEISIQFHKENDKLIPDVDLRWETPEGRFIYNDGTFTDEFPEIIYKNKKIYPSDIIELNNDSLKQILETAKDGDGI